MNCAYEERPFCNNCKGVEKPEKVMTEEEKKYYSCEYCRTHDYIHCNEGM